MSEVASGVRALLVDLDGVVRRWPPRDDGLETAHGLPAGAIRGVAFADPLLGDAITGRLSDDEWRDEIVRRLLERHPGAAVRAAVTEWSRPAGEVDRETLDVLRRARDAVPVVLVTNATSRLPRDLAALGLSGEFDDAEGNVCGAARLGIPGHRFRDAASLADRLGALDLA